MTTSERTPDLRHVARQRTSEAAHAMRLQLPGLVPVLRTQLAEAVPELRGDSAMQELLGASTESNVESFFLLAEGVIGLDDVHLPPAALEYARRLAQRGISSHALLRSYRAGQQRVLDWAFDEIALLEPDATVAYAAIKYLQAISFDFVDRLAEEVVVEHETERERWLANRNTVRSAMLSELIEGRDVDVAAGEQALGYRLRQQHLGVVMWGRAGDGSTAALRHLEASVAGLAAAVGAVGHALFVPQDASSCWVWLPVARDATLADDVVLDRVRGALSPTIRVALGTPHTGLGGFRTSHVEALRAFTVASVAGDHADAVTTYADPGVRAAALLVGDLDAARDLIDTTLGALADPGESAARLRHTLQVFLAVQGSYLAAAERLHVHKNTVKYRVDKAIECRGRALDDDRFNLELALLACRWLGPAVLASS